MSMANFIGNTLGASFKVSLLVYSFKLIVYNQQSMKSENITTILVKSSPLQRHAENLRQATYFDY